MQVSFIIFIFVRVSKTILIKIASRERPEQLLKTVSECVRLASDTSKLIWLFSFDEDDVTNRTREFNNGLLNLIEPTGQGHLSLSVTGNSENKIHAINRDIDQAMGDWQILLNLSDDQRPIVKGWDEVIRKAMLDSLDASLWFSDEVQKKINTQEIVGRKYYDRFGYIYYPDYKSFFCDNESTLVASKLGKQIRLNQCLFKHFHHGVYGGIPKDSLYERNDKYWNEDSELYKKRLNINFGL